MNEKKVSIIVPVYKTEQFLQKCLDSLVKQTLDSIEIIIVNDGSPDNSETIIKKYEKNYPKLIKYIKIKNSGVSVARNTGISIANGQYIGFCDSDDYVEIDMFEQLYNKACEEKADIVVSGYYDENENGYIINNGLDNLSFYSKSLIESPDLLLINNAFCNNKIFSHQMLQNSNISFNSKYRIFEDLLFVYSSFLKANKIEKVNRCFYHYIRRKNESVTGQLNEKFYDLFPVMKELREFYCSNSKYDFSHYLTYLLLNHSILRFSSPVTIKKIPLKYRFIKDSYNYFDEFDANWENNIYFKQKKRTSSIYKTKFIWFIVPFIAKRRTSFKNIIKKVFYNYGKTFIKEYNKPIFGDSILFDSQQGNDINGNMFYLIKEVNDNKKYKDYHINIAVNKNRKNEFTKKLDSYNICNYNLLIKNSKQYIRHLARDKYLFTDTSLPVYFMKREEQVYLNTWHGTPLKYLGKKVAYDFYNISNVLKNFNIADYILYPNDFMAKVMVEDYMLYLRKSKILMSGYPRNSIFFTNKTSNNKIKIAYMPTWRGTLNNINGGNYIDKLKDILKELDSKLLPNQELYMNLHPYLKGKINTTNYKNIKLFPFEYETYDFLNSCDILITDYSSVFFDYANTKKKIILFVYDKEEYLTDRGMYLDIDDLPFPKVYNVDELISLINDKKEIQYNDFLENYCKYDNKDVPRNIMSLVINNDNNSSIILDNKSERRSSLLICNNYRFNSTNKEIIECLKQYNNKTLLYLGFENHLLSKNKEFLHLIPQTVNYWGYFDEFAFTSIYEKILLKRIKKDCNVYKNHFKKFDKIFSQELQRRYGDSFFDNVILYKEKNIQNIYLYSYMKATKYIVLDSISNIDIDILNKYDKIFVENEKDHEFLENYIDKNKVFNIKEYNINL